MVQNNTSKTKKVMAGRSRFVLDNLARCVARHLSPELNAATKSTNFTIFWKMFVQIAKIIKKSQDRWSLTKVAKFIREIKERSHFAIFAIFPLSSRALLEFKFLRRFSSTVSRIFATFAILKAYRNFRKFCGCVEGVNMYHVNFGCTNQGSKCVRF